MTRAGARYSPPECTACEKHPQTGEPDTKHGEAAFCCAGIMPAMRRLARRTFNALTVLSLLLFVATCVLWVRSYRVDDVFYRHDGSYWTSSACSFTGSLSFTAIHAPPHVRTTSSCGDATWQMVNALVASGDPGLRSTGKLTAVAWIISDGGTSSTTGVTFPPRRMFSVRHWFPAAVLVAAPICWIVGFARRRRFPAGRCDQCGYDLTGNVSGVCPECGAIIAKPSS